MNPIEETLRELPVILDDVWTRAVFPSRRETRENQWGKDSEQGGLEPHAIGWRPGLLRTGSPPGEFLLRVRRGGGSHGFPPPLWLVVGRPSLDLGPTASLGAAVGGKLVDAERNTLDPALLHVARAALARVSGERS